MKCVVSVQTLRAELLWVVAGVGREDQGLQAWAPRACLAQQPKSISATRFSTFKTASYEGDAYINQLGHYCVDREYALARYSHEYLIQFPIWPTEWHLHSVLMAWADYLYTGETLSLETFYEDLCNKTLIGLARDDGLISTESQRCTREFEQLLHLHHSLYRFDQGLKDLVDWPPGSFSEGGQGERDGQGGIAAAR
jgi:hypothetical protein